MNDPIAPRKARGWPLFAISVLILLLAGFLVLRVRKKEDIPLIVKPPAPSATDRRTPDSSTDPELDRDLKALKEALEAKRWDDAAAAFEAARKRKPDAPELQGIEEAIARGRRLDEAARLAAQQKAELAHKMEREWAVVKEKVEKDVAENLWNAAIRSLDLFAAQFPDILHDTVYDNELKQVKVYQSESDGLFKQNMAEAQKLLAQEQYGQSYVKAETAFKYYPERKEQVRAFQSKLQQLQMQKSMIRIPSTPCWIGSEDNANEKPLRQVKLPAFFIDRYPVTNDEYYAFISSTNRPAPLHWGAARKPIKGHERHPVVFVTWEDAQAYAQWAGKRLPTAEEWEVAARGPDKREYPWGNTFLEKEDSYPCNCLEYWQVHKSLAPGTTPVDAKEFDNGESAFGVFGMGGNVWEWTATAAPPSGSKPPPEFRVLKGGSFMTPHKATRCAKVYAEDPRLPHPDVGFRCARDVD